MNSIFQFPNYLLKRQAIALTGRFRFRYELDLDFSMDTTHRLDRRLGIAAGILMATVEGKQSS